MFPLGHIGLTLGLVELLRGKVPLFARLDYRWLAVGAMLPDAIDKPLGHALLDWGTGRLWGHTLLFTLVMAMAAALALPRRPSLGLAFAALGAGSATHLAFDEMWNLSTVLAWPLLGFEMPQGDIEVGNWVTTLLTNRYVQATEALGFVALCATAWRVYRRGEFWHYLSLRRWPAEPSGHSGRLI